MVTKVINSPIFVHMIQLGARNLANYKEMINKLNVFPVPDGDTGTNMNLSMQSGVSAIQETKQESLSSLLEAYVKGLLMGARGNSGVILSQLFKGFSDDVQGKYDLSPIDFAAALNKGVEKAYQAVTNPVEGTILTVAKDAALKAETVAKNSDDLVHLMEEVLKEAKASLERTPDLLPVLKEVGVVDSGGQGLVVIYEGFLAALQGKELPEPNDELNMEEQIAKEHDQAVQAFMSADDIEFGYCTEFFVEFTNEKENPLTFDENQFRNQLSEYGDSLLVAATDEFVKIHIHTEKPGKVMTIAQQYGELMNIDIENMRKQHKAIVEEPHQEAISPEKDIAVITVALGHGMKEMLKSIGATAIIEGGQTMNPSTEDILLAIKKTNANVTYVLPNNKNILMAANQAKELAEKEVIVIPSKTIPQGIAALFAFDESMSVAGNQATMLEAMADIKTGLITFATRDTTVNEIAIQKNAYIGMNDETILATNPNKNKVTQSLIQQLVSDDDELLTIFIGEDVTEEETDELKQALRDLEDIEIEYHYGNQPLYSYILMVE